MKKHWIIISSTLFLLLFACSKKEIRIACVGDSITEGYGLAWQSRASYPVLLDSILGDGYTVLNSGQSATTLRKGGNFPFWTTNEFSNIFAYEPDIITVMLGTNDTKSENWNAELFEKDYQFLIDTFKVIPTQPKIILCLPVPVFKTVWGINDSTVVNGVIPIVKRLADKNHLQIIDLYDSMKNQGANFPDSIHPNEQAVKVMAEIMASEISKNK